MPQGGLAWSLGPNVEVFVQPETRDLPWYKREMSPRAIGIFAESFRPQGPVIEIGSLYLPGYEALSDLRPRFPGREFWPAWLSRCCSVVWARRRGAAPSA